MVAVEWFGLRGVFVKRMQERNILNSMVFDSKWEVNLVGIGENNFDDSVKSNSFVVHFLYKSKGGQILCIEPNKISNFEGGGRGPMLVGFLLLTMLSM